MLFFIFFISYDGHQQQICQIELTDGLFSFAVGLQYAQNFQHRCWIQQNTVIEHDTCNTLGVCWPVNYCCKLLMIDAMIMMMMMMMPQTTPNP